MKLVLDQQAVIRSEKDLSLQYITNKKKPKKSYHAAGDHLLLSVSSKTQINTQVLSSCRFSRCSIADVDI